VTDLSIEKDYTYYWQLWHHNWDDKDAACIQQTVQLEDKTVLEAGCGDGRVSFYLAPFCKRLIGIDINERFIDIAQQRLKQSTQNNVEFHRMDAQDLKLASDAMDVVLFPWVLQMVRDPHLAVKEAYRVLRKGGELLVIGLRSDADYDSIIGQFANTEVFDPVALYEQPLKEHFGTDLPIIENQAFHYFFENADIAFDAFVFALRTWYSTTLNNKQSSALKETLGSYQIDGRIHLRFPANVYIAKK